MKSITRLVAALAAALIALGAPSAPAAAGDPTFFTPFPPPESPVVPPPIGYLIGPCGVAVDSAGRFYVSDYYHHAVDVFKPEVSVTMPWKSYLTQLAGIDPLDGPCGLALDSTSHLYVNDFDRGVIKYGNLGFFGIGTAITGAGVDAAHPTGVAVDPTNNNAYVDDRTYITAYASSGTQVMDGSEPLKIGVGTLGDGYGLAIGTAGRIYAADASDDTVKVYDPSISKTTPSLTITGPPGGFTSLRAAALAVDRLNGVLYVIDNLQPIYTEQPAAQVEVFDATSGAYLGVLKYQIVDALPAGLAVNQANGLVYVTSGNTVQAGIYIYPAGSQVSSSLPPLANLSVQTSGTGAGMVSSSLGDLECSGACTAQIRSGAQVTLSATPDPDSAFAGWSGGGCEGTAICTVWMGEARSVTAEFETAPGIPPAEPQPAQGSASVPLGAPAVARRARQRHRHRSHHRHRHVRDHHRTHKKHR